MARASTDRVEVAVADTVARFAAKLQSHVALIYVEPKAQEVEILKRIGAHT